MELTEKEVRKYHEEMWDWLSKNPGKNKHNWPGWTNIDVFEDQDDFEEDCFLCEHYSKCEECPLNSPITKSCCDSEGDVFDRWESARIDLTYRWSGDSQATQKSIIAALLIRDVFKRQEARNG